MRYFVGLGSNIEPRRNFPLMLRALLSISPAVHIGRVVQTDPVGVVGAPFLNAAAAITTDLSPGELKAFLNTVEARLGRDRADPGSKTRSRTADLDIIFPLAPGVVSVPPDLLPREPYVRPMLLELLDALGVTAGAQPAVLASGAPLSLDGLPFGEVPRTFTSAGGRLTAADLAPARTAPAHAGRL